MKLMLSEQTVRNDSAELNSFTVKDIAIVISLCVSLIGYKFFFVCLFFTEVTRLVLEV